MLKLPFETPLDIFTKDKKVYDGIKYQELLDIINQICKDNDINSDNLYLTIEQGCMTIDKIYK